MKESFGTLPSGETATLYTITNGRLTAAVTDYGATLVRLLVPDVFGNMADVVLGHDDCIGYPSDVICELAPEARKLLGIPEDHYMKLIVGFGYPEIPYARGAQKDRSAKIHRYTKEHPL